MRLTPAALLALSLAACSGGSKSNGFDDDGGAGASSSGGSSGTSSSGFVPGGDGGSSSGGDAGNVTTSSIIYANTDDSLYSLDPATNAVTLVGKFSGQSGSDTNVTDCAVDASGKVYVNTSTAIYEATLPAAGGGPVQLKKVADIAVKSTQKFYALAFAPAGVLGAGESLVGGDGNGELWAIDAATGATHELGNFGPDKTGVFALSGDIVFYTDAAGKPTGLATIRSCKSGGTNCTTTDDYLAGIDMTALATAYTSGTPATKLLSGIYGGSATSKGSGIMHGELFGLGAWEGNVFGFERASANNGTPALLSIDTTSGAGKILPGTFTFTNGWSGACVTTKVTVTVPPPPPPPN